MLIDVFQHYLLPALFFTGLLAGTIDAIAGGGGLISLPILMGFGIPPHIALGTNKLQGLFGTASATYSYYKQGALSRKGLYRGIIFSFVGAATGAIVNQYLSGEILRKIIPILLFIVLCYIFFSPKLGDKDVKPKMNEKLFYLIFGSLLGFYDGFFGPGVGAFWVFILVLLLGYNLLKATAYTKAFNLNTNIAAVIFFAIGNNIDYKIALVMAVGQLIGGRLGAQLAIKKGVSLIRPVFFIVVTSTIATLVYRSYATSEFNAMLKQPYALILFISTLLISTGIYTAVLFRRRRSVLEK
jgi:uncharacterized membrane protein YfcA